MKEQLTEVIDSIREKKEEVYRWDEASTKQGIILRLLNALGWDAFNPDDIRPEYSVENQRVDYALIHKGKPKVFIEVKRISENLEQHQEQLLTYSFKIGVKLAVLTNGISWWFYLPLNEGTWEERKFYTIEIFEQETEDIVDKFIKFLSKENVITNKAIENAEYIYRNKQKTYLIQTTLPKAWRKIISEPDEILVELIAETTEKICGYKPDNQLVISFIRKRLLNRANENYFTNRKTKKSTSQTIGRYKLASPNDNFTGKKITGFHFLGKDFQVNSWKDFYITILSEIYKHNSNTFYQITTIKGKTRPYFTSTPSLLRNPLKIPNTNLYAETNLSAQNIVNIISKKIFPLFGYTDKDLIIYLVK